MAPSVSRVARVVPCAVDAVLVVSKLVGNAGRSHRVQAAAPAFVPAPPCRGPHRSRWPSACVRPRRPPASCPGVPISAPSALWAHVPSTPWTSPSPPVQLLGPRQPALRDRGLHTAPVGAAEASAAANAAAW